MPLFAKITIISSAFSLSMIILVYMNFWQAKNVPLEPWPVIKYLIWSGLIIFLLVNPIIVTAYKFGFKWFGNKIWIPQLIYKWSDILPAIIIGIWLLGEKPAKGTLVGLILTTIGVLFAVSWK